jgi:hypothetical protein
LLREFWKTHRSPEWLFPAPGLEHPVDPVTGRSLQRAFCKAWKKTEIAKRAHVHSLRHYSESRTMPSSIALICAEPEVAGPRRRCAGKILGIVRSDLQTGEKGQK